MNLSEIMDKYAAGELTKEQADAELVKAGYSPTKNLTEEERAAQKAREDAEECIPGTGGPDVPDAYPDTVDMRRRKDKAGIFEDQQLSHGVFRVFYDNLGYATHAKRLI